MRPFACFFSYFLPLAGRAVPQSTYLKSFEHEASSITHLVEINELKININDLCSLYGASHTTVDSVSSYRDAFTFDPNCTQVHVLKHCHKSLVQSTNRLSQIENDTAMFDPNLIDKLDCIKIHKQKIDSLVSEYALLTNCSELKGSNELFHPCNIENLSRRSSDNIFIEERKKTLNSEIARLTGLMMEHRDYHELKELNEYMERITEQDQLQQNVTNLCEQCQIPLCKRL